MVLTVESPSVLEMKNHELKALTCGDDTITFKLQLYKGLKGVHNQVCS